MHSSTRSSGPASLIQVGAALCGVHAHSHAALTPAHTRLRRTHCSPYPPGWASCTPQSPPGRTGWRNNSATCCRERRRYIAPVHGDFYAKQVLLDCDRLWSSISTLPQRATRQATWPFIAHLRGEIARHRTRALVEECTHALLEGYAGSTGRQYRGWAYLHRRRAD